MTQPSEQHDGWDWWPNKTRPKELQKPGGYCERCGREHKWRILSMVKGKTYHLWYGPHGYEIFSSVEEAIDGADKTISSSAA